METIAIIILGIAFAAALFFLLRSREQQTRLAADVNTLRQSQATEQKSHADIVASLKESHEREIANMQKQFDASQAEQRHQQEQARTELQRQNEAARAELQRQHEAAKQEMQQQWEEKLKTMRLEFDKLSAEHLKMQQADMKATNKESVENLLNPLRQTIETFKKEFADKMTSTERNDAVMKEALSQLQQKTELLDQSATNLARALKADPKKQGNWGEEILKNILEASGMEEGRDFETQSQEEDEDGNRYIPDVKVKIPGEGYLIIDSKTSTKAYLEYLEAEDEVTQKQKLREHIDSVTKHYKELAAKHYSKKVKDAANYVLMFVPNEGSYLLAMENRPQLASEAFRERIIIVNPTNLMLALKIVSLLWQNQKQEQNVRDILEAATKLYEKFASFSDSFVNIGERLQGLTNAYDTARIQLTDGRGNFARQLESFKIKGVITNKNINPKLLEDNE